MATLITINHHDNGYDLAEGTIVRGVHAGPVVGKVFWDTTGDIPGYVLRIADTESYPTSIDEIEGELAALGYHLETNSRDDILGLAE